MFLVHDNIALFYMKFYNIIKYSQTPPTQNREQDWDRASFQIGVSDLVQLIMKGRLRHGSGPAQFTTSSPLHA